ncbi:MAG: ribosome silencing factor [Magnetococcales bacterium]|nr:ribosome silencing factor [Magnetococcales bacterium]
MTNSRDAINSEQFVELLKNHLDDRKGEEVQVIDLRGRSAFTDFFIIATGRSSTHVGSLADEVDRFAHEHGIHAQGVEGRGEGGWVLVDLGDVVAHLFQREIRKQYDLDRLWGEASQVLDKAQSPVLATAEASEPEA